MKPRTEPVQSRSRCGDPVILCVDDESEIRGALWRCFRNEPYEVITAAGAEEALGWLAELPVVDLILTDERMPNRGPNSSTRSAGVLRKRSASS